MAGNEPLDRGCGDPASPRELLVGPASSLSMSLESWIFLLNFGPFILSSSRSLVLVFLLFQVFCKHVFRVMVSWWAEHVNIRSCLCFTWVAWSLLHLRATQPAFFWQALQAFSLLPHHDMKVEPMYLVHVPCTGSCTFPGVAPPTCSVTVVCTVSSLFLLLPLFPVHFGF